jgi:hypothetical protein
VVGRDPDGRPWCLRCRRRHGHETADAALREQIIDTVIRADPALSEETIRLVLTKTAPFPRSRHLLAAHLATNPDVFIVGPTSTLAVLDRFTRGLIAASSERLRTLHPVCDHCGRQLPWHAGRSCRTCWTRSDKQTCQVCGMIRRLGHQDAHGGAICDYCVDRQRRRVGPVELVDRIVAVVSEADGSLNRAQAAAALDRAVRGAAARTVLVDQLAQGPSLTLAAPRHTGVARLLAELRADGAALPAALCHDCSGPAEPLITHCDVVRCRRCAARCSGCGRFNTQPGALWCQRCRAERGRSLGTCSDCKRADRPLDANHRCRQCREQAEHSCAGCGQATRLTWHQADWMCHRCVLAIELDEKLSPARQLPPEFVALRSAILEADNPHVVRRWLRNSAAGRLLPRLASGEVPVSHQALDDAGEDQSISHLRALLVSIGTLPPEDRTIDRFERFANRYIDTRIVHALDRKAVRSWLRWHVLSRLRKRAEGGATITNSTGNARQALRQVAEFLETLRRRDRKLSTANQTDIDDWFARPGANPLFVRQFLVWARKRAHLPRDLRIPPSPPKVIRPALDDTTRWTIARRLITDDTISVDDRVAAALVVLYAQTLTRIAKLSRSDLQRSPTGETVTVVMDANPVPIHEPFATLIEQLPQRRTHGVSDQFDSPWLFPGRKAGEHVHIVILGQRLRALGIEPRNMRNTARAQLAAEIPAAVLGKLIGVSDDTAANWANVTKANWISYAADRSQ